MKTYFSNAAEREAKKVVAEEINKFMGDNKLKVVDVKKVLKIATTRISAIKQMDLGRFDLETLEDFLDKLKGVSDG